jgi:hypothetical protein
MKLPGIADVSVVGRERALRTRKAHLRRVVIALLVGSLLSVVGLAGAQSGTRVPVATLELWEGSVAAGIEDFSGNYAAAGAGATVGGGGEAMIMRNQNGVVIELTSTTQGASLKAATSGLRLSLVP